MVLPIPRAQKTTECIIASLPCESELVHSRYCGRELCFAIKTHDFPPIENQRSVVDKFDVAYWRNWESPENGLPGSPGMETVSFYYGSEILNFRTMPIQVNVFGRIDESQESVLDEIGNRVWQCGFEQVSVEMIMGDT